MNNSLGAAIQRCRRDLKTSVEQLAVIVDLSAGTIRAIEQGRRLPSAEALHKIDRALGMNLVWLDHTTVVLGAESFALARFPGDNLSRRSETLDDSERLAIVTKVLSCDDETLRTIKRLFA